MCGIVGYTGKNSALTPVIEGLRRLEYRGYDSAGIALGTPGKLFIEKKAGKLSNLENALDATLPNVHSGIGHTRWATHGEPNDINSHPHSSMNGKFVIIHNGIIENYAPLKAELKKRGHKFESATDTEVLVHLIEDIQQRENVALDEAAQLVHARDAIRHRDFQRLDLATRAVEEHDIALARRHAHHGDAAAITCNDVRDLVVGDDHIIDVGIEIKKVWH